MEIIKMKCPHCGAEMDLNEEHTIAVCSYCGSKQYIDTESAQDEAYEARQRKRAEHLADQLDAIADGIREEDRIRDKLLAATGKCSSLQSELKNIKKQGRQILLSVIGVAFLFVCAGAGSDMRLPFRILTELFLVAAAVGLCRLIYFRYKAKQERCSAKLDKCRENEEDIRCELAEAQEQYDPSPLPAEYQHDLEAIEFLKRMVLAGRARNLQDAVILYEEQCHRRDLEQKLELQQIQMMNLQQSLNEKNKAEAKQKSNGAGGNGMLETAAAVGSVMVGVKVLKDIGKHLL